MADGDYMRLSHGGCSFACATSTTSTKPPRKAYTITKLVRKQFTWSKTENRACKHCGTGFEALGPNLYCSAQCKTLQTKQMQRVKDEARRKPKRQTAILRRCLWCLSKFSASLARMQSGNQSGWFCSRDCSFADRALHGRPDGKATRAAWRNYGKLFEPKQIRTAKCGDCGAVVNAQAKRCEDCNRLRNNRKTAAYQRTMRSAVRQCPSCSLMWSSIGKAGGRQHCHTSECNNAFEVHQRDLRRESKRRTGGSYKARARRVGAACETFDPLHVLARDHWRCQLCGVKTPQAKRGSIDDDAPELDHIVPLSKGGGHTRANTQCLCRRCNGAKSDTARGQLGLGW